jgi:hypothetical protein
MTPSVVTAISVVVSVLTTFGVGGLLVAFFQHRFEHEKEVKGQEHDLKQRRYGCILILMLTRLDPTALRHTHEHRPDLQNMGDVEKELRAEMLNSILFASDDVVRSMAEFINRPTYGSYVKTAASMRKDLWGRGTSIGEEVLTLIADQAHK